MRAFMEGFFLFWRGARLLRTTSRVWALCVVPVILNALLFVAVVFVLVVFVWPVLADWTTFSWAPHWLLTLFAWVIRAAVLVLFFVIYAFLFPIIAEIVGAPFYEAIGARVDAEAGVSIVERPWYREVTMTVNQEARKLVALMGIGVFIFVLQFAPVVGQVLSAVIGFGALVVTLGADGVGPALTRRGLTLHARRAWVLKHLRLVMGLGVAKAIGLAIPVLNIVVLPIAAVGGTLLVQKVESRSKLFSDILT
ncbi:EI24 domain-containing protein [Candidatus Uhrbacteria bacterium]|nr:EI24 domain-containing protein [Candidatus Uhrbacteria bacterium]